ncbi:flavodoxin domain-containing protein [Marinilabilia salmonicolor]|uniref:flavodoxin domain-containing protein n=1 Tax=Marinilabilia salmonicolor TaxID=989 RepID=UPI000299DB3E|nr:flavodoxin domain-containing protein [Marinilabilia salmonicolor]
MKTAIIYSSKHGTTRKVAEEIANLFSTDEVTLIKAGQPEEPDLGSYDKIIIGGSIHAGTISKALRKFLKSNRNLLLQKQLGLFLCCMFEEEAEEQMHRAFPEDIRSHAKTCHWVGGEFLFEEMNFIEKTMTRKITGVTESVSKLKHDKINQLVQELS